MERMNTPLVSVITPVFNAAEFLTETIHSVRNQTYCDWEHILVNDGSTDGSAELIKKVAAADSRIHLLELERCGSPALARNRGIESARGKYIAFLDADDLWLPQKLERSVAWMESKSYGFIYHDYRAISRDGKKIGTLIMGPNRLDFQTLHTHRGTGGCLSVVIDREKVPDFEFPYHYQHEDFLGWLRLVKKGHVGYRLPEDLGRYRVSKTSRSGNKIACAVACWRIYRNESNLRFGHALNWWMQYVWRAYWMHLKATPR